MKNEDKENSQIMSDISSSCDEIVEVGKASGQGLKHIPHWPPVNIDFEDVVYTVDNAGQSSEFIAITNKDF